MTDLQVKLRAAVADELPAAVALRHRLHADPRVSGDEADTTAEVVRALDAGPGQEVAGTGRMVRIGGDGPSVALRAETAPSGAEDIVRSGVLATHDVRAIIAAHLQPRLPDGVVAVTPGPVNAATDEFEVTITGVGGHAGYPHVARDPVLALCQTVVSLQQVASRRFDPVLGAVCSVGQIGGGSAVNVVPETASARGTVRVMRDADRAEAASLISEIVSHTAAAYGCEGRVRFDPGEPVLVNDPVLAAGAAERLAAAGITADDGFRSYGADDFSHYGAVTRGLMLFVGTAPSDARDAPGLHHEAFLPPDRMIARTAEALLAGYLAAIRT